MFPFFPFISISEGILSNFKTMFKKISIFLQIHVSPGAGSGAVAIRHNWILHRRIADWKKPRSDIFTLP